MAAFQSNAFQNNAFQTGGATGVTGALAWTEQDDVCAMSAVLVNAGALAWVESDDVTSISGTVGSPSVTGSLSWSEDDDTTALSGALRNAAALAWTEADDVTAITGAVLTPVSGSLGWIEQDDTTAIEAAVPVSARLGGFEMVNMEPTWRRALRKRAEAKAKVELSRPKRKRAELIEKLAAKEALSSRPDAQIETRIRSLLDEWVELAPKLDLKPVEEVPRADAYAVFMARVAEHVRRLEEEDDENAAEMLLLM